MINPATRKLLGELAIVNNPFQLATKASGNVL